jgi:hypothetical protein
VDLYLKTTAERIDILNKIKDEPQFEAIYFDYIVEPDMP